jgi:hypothetical protein
MAKTSKQVAKEPAYTEADLNHYASLIGLDAAVLLLMKRAKSANKFAIKRAKCLSTSPEISKDRRTGLAMARPDGRLNGYNIASSSLVGRMGGKRKAKKSKKGY